MAKSDQITVASRVQDVLRLILAGAEFADVRQYASDRGWAVSDRQVRRYIERAHKRFAQATRRDRKQLLGRHLMQRRALYARAIKTGDLRTALQVLRDEAALEGLYPADKLTATVSAGQPLLASGSQSLLGRQERLVQLLAAESTGNKQQRRLVEQATPLRTYHLPDTMMPQQMLHILTMSYVAEQLDQAVMMVNAMFCQTTGIDDDPWWELVGQASAYRFQIGREGWQQFCHELGIDGDWLVKANYQGLFLDLYDEKICELAPTADELLTTCQAAGHAIGRLTTADDQARQWRKLFGQVCQE